MSEVPLYLKEKPVLDGRAFSHESQISSSGWAESGHLV